MHETPGVGTVGPTLETDTEPWTAYFPGLGHAFIDRDGYRVEPEERPDTDPDTAAQRAAALEFGWAELLANVRRGWYHAPGLAMSPVDSGPTLLILGDPHDSGLMAIELAERGWLASGDRPQPLSWDGTTLLAMPRKGPILVSQRRAMRKQITGTPVRGDTDSVIVDIARRTEPAKVGAVVTLRPRKPNDETFEPLSGHQRFETAASLFLRGALNPGTDESHNAGDGDKPSPTLIADHLKLAQLPYARLHIDSDTMEDNVQQLSEWTVGLGFAKAPGNTAETTSEGAS